MSAPWRWHHLILGLRGRASPVFRRGIGAVVRAPALTAALLALGQACNDGGPAAAHPPASLRKVAGDGQSAPVGAAVTTPPSVVVLDADQKPVAGVAVTFAVTAEGGSLTGGISTSDASGTARVSTWTLGPTVGTDTLTATVAGLPQVTFTATATPSADWVVTKKIGDGQTATVATAVAIAPAVLVTDGQGKPEAGVTVVFQVSGGAGRLTGASPTTDSSGIAAVGAWILGTASGTDTLTATATGLTPVTFIATGTSGPATELVKQADNIAAPVGTPVAPAPAVLPSDAFGNPVAGVAVTFAVASGGGSVSGGAVTTGRTGVARVGSWTLGTVAGTNTLTAIATGVPQATFTATGTAGPAATITAQAGDGQTASPWSSVAVRPSVLVRDAFSNPVPGAAVTFSVASGGGFVPNTNAISYTTGIATVGSWTLGPGDGTNTLAASMPGLRGVTFTATAVGPVSCATPYTLGSSTVGALSTKDCQLPFGPYMHLLTTTASATQSVTFTMSSTAFLTSLSLFDSSGSIVVAASDWCDPESQDCSVINSSSGFWALLGPGTYIVGASSSDASAVGAYTLASNLLPEDVTGCGQVWITTGVTTSQRIDTTDCAAVFRSVTYYSDQFTINLTAGRTYTFSMSSTDFDTYLELWSEGTVVASNDDYGGTMNSQFTFTPTVSKQYVINAATYLGAKTGAYTLTVQ